MLISRLRARLRDDAVPEVQLERLVDASWASETDKERERDRVSDTVWDTTEEDRWMGLRLDLPLDPEKELDVDDRTNLRLGRGLDRVSVSLSPSENGEWGNNLRRKIAHTSGSWNLNLR